MTLARGARLGPYEVLTPLGAGGMGEVYRAQDTRLDRTVALKVLPTDTIPSPEARSRFEREARAISRLSHPHICTLFDVGREGDADYLVMELVEGETLRERLSRGPLPLPELVRFGTEIADALDLAHRRGIIHRDLKPGNVMLARSGVKLLDFGLARQVASDLPAAEGSEAQTAPAPLTVAGRVLGTLQYMAPEQLEGKPADARSDVFAFGCVLYEMATARSPFTGKSASALASEILHGHVAPLADLRPECPPALERLVRFCLARDPDERWQSLHDVKLQLGSLDASLPTRAAVPPGTRGFARLAWAVAALAAGIAVVALLWTPPPRGGGSLSVRFSLHSPEGTTFAGWTEATTFALSPDGATLAFIATGAHGRRIYLRPLASLEARPLEGTEGAFSAFWSPDGRSLGFFADRKLKRLDLDGGAPVPICDVRPGSGLTGTWGSDGQVLFASVEGSAIFRVSSAGGEPERVHERQPEAGIERVGWPSFLPDGKRYLYLVRKSDRTIRVMLAEVGRPGREIAPADSFAQYVAPGYLVFVREGTLLAQPFDAATGEVSGDPFAVADSVNSFQTIGWAAFSVSPSGVLAYSKPNEPARLAWFDRSGRGQPLDSTAAPLWVRLSPDGHRALFNRRDPRTGNLDIWSLDLARGVESRLTSDPDTETWGMLLPDGDLIYSEPRGAAPRLMKRDLASGETRELSPEGGFQVVNDLTPDARTLVFAERIDFGPWGLFTLPAEGGSPAPLLATRFDAFELRLSPDGRHAAFVSSETGKPEVYVSPFPTLGERVRVSQEGGMAPRWSPDGSEIFYLAADRHLVAVPVRAETALVLGQPNTLFALEGRYGWGSYDVAPDGRFLAIVPEALTKEQPLMVAVNWLAEARAATQR